MPQVSEESRILGIAKKMESVFMALEDYACEVDQVFYKKGVEDQHYRFKFYFKKDKKIRVDFSPPYSKLIIFYHDAEKEATVLPFRSLPVLKFRFSIDNPLIKTSAGQRIDQTDMGYFIAFLFKNLKQVRQGPDEFFEDQDRVWFLFRALDYIEGKDIEKYRVFISKENWLPSRIERYDLEDKPIEVSDIKNYSINVHLQDAFFNP